MRLTVATGKSHPQNQHPLHSVSACCVPSPMMPQTFHEAPDRVSSQLRDIVAF